MTLIQFELAFFGANLHIRVGRNNPAVRLSHGNPLP